MDAYRMEFRGWEFDLNLEAPDLVPTTTAAPNVRVISGPWKTWHIDPRVGPPAQPPIIARSVNPTDSSREHPAGNLTPSESVTDGHYLIIDPLGFVKKAPVGRATIMRIPTEPSA